MKRIITIFTLSTVLISSSAFIINSSGYPGQTGAPGEGTCSNCHGGGSGTTSVSISATPAFTGNQYIPGQTYTVTVTVTNNLFTRFGFGCEILNSSNGNAGTMTTAFSGVHFMNSGAKKNATHTTPGTTGVFSFEWTAPASGNATIYAAGNAVNLNGNTGGDRPGNTSLPLTALGTGINKEEISSSSLTLFPNPTASELTLQYQLLNGGDVKVDLYNLSGQLISHIISEEQDSGIHSVNEKLPADLSAGIYIIKLTVNGQLSAQKMFARH